jgi:pyrroloquinoline quinone (PQQ) biosynthesis protein C
MSYCQKQSAVDAWRQKSRRVCAMRGFGSMQEIEAITGKERQSMA